MTQAVVPSHLVMTERLLGARLLGWIFPRSVITPRGVAEGNGLGWGEIPMEMCGWDSPLPLPCEAALGSEDALKGGM